MDQLWTALVPLIVGSALVPTLRGRAPTGVALVERHDRVLTVMFGVWFVAKALEGFGVS